MRRRVATLTVALMLACGLAREARSTTVEQLSAEELVARARLIVWGDVVSVRAARDPDGRIFTHVEVAPRETLKGEGAATVSLKLPGGVVDGVAAVFHGMPRLEQGEEVVLHVSGANPRSGVRVPVGLGQGVHHVLRPAHGPALASRDTRDLHLVRPGGGPGQAGQRDEVALDDLLATVRTEVARQRAQGGGR